MAKSEATKEKNRVYMRARYANDRAKFSADVYVWQSNNRNKAAYYFQKSSARRRGVPFLLTFDEWWATWEASGKWEQRGRSNEHYCMARYRDQGPYAVGNVRICTNLENQREQVRKGRRKRPFSEAHRAALSKAWEKRRARHRATNVL
jgi:hypothetical protein